jgi:hypothetical protein
MLMGIYCTSIPSGAWEKHIYAPAMSQKNEAVQITIELDWFSSLYKIWMRHCGKWLQKIKKKMQGFNVVCGLPNLRNMERLRDVMCMRWRATGPTNGNCLCNIGFGHKNTFYRLQKLWTMYTLVFVWVQERAW